MREKSYLLNPKWKPSPLCPPPLGFSAACAPAAALEGPWGRGSHGDPRGPPLPPSLRPAGTDPSPPAVPISGTPPTSSFRVPGVSKEPPAQTLFAVPNPHSVRLSGGARVGKPQAAPKAARLPPGGDGRAGAPAASAPPCGGVRRRPAAMAPRKG